MQARYLLVHDVDFYLVAVRGKEIDAERLGYRAEMGVAVSQSQSKRMEGGSGRSDGDCVGPRCARRIPELSDQA